MNCKYKLNNFWLNLEARYTSSTRFSINVTDPSTFTFALLFCQIPKIESRKLVFRSSVITRKITAACYIYYYLL